MPARESGARVTLHRYTPAPPTVVAESRTTITWEVWRDLTRAELANEYSASFDPSSLTERRYYRRHYLRSRRVSWPMAVLCNVGAWMDDLANSWVIS